MCIRDWGLLLSTERFRSVGESGSPLAMSHLIGFAKVGHLGSGGLQRYLVNTQVAKPRPGAPGVVATGGPFFCLGERIASRLPTSSAAPLEVGHPGCGALKPMSSKGDTGSWSEIRSPVGKACDQRAHRRRGRARPHGNATARCPGDAGASAPGRRRRRSARPASDCLTLPRARSAGWRPAPRQRDGS